MAEGPLAFEEKKSTSRTALQLTGQTPPDTIRSNDRASGIPWMVPVLPEVKDSSMDFCFSSPLNES